ncbi:metal ABC transporter substrate-binding protein [uncultured Eubacterium sp.]|uniref:metal ABC transporter substrate-binding protein n=1 Tax=uncultured Eubacterium sp. TaxID=165185 RepID=UPI0025D2F691|nr:metal ABC transporter substrate-binding protein [uncultured Eubacterium sp.]MCI6538341.1 zinc ABC transporter substrate-binding protein [Lachnospiraceae bacterium]
MKNKYVFTAVLLAVILFVGSVLTMAYVRTEQKKEQAKDGDLLVVTSFYPMYVAAENVIGDVEGVTLENLSEPQTGCLHDYQLTAADMKLLSKADVFIVNGGGIESFLSDVAESYPNLKIIQACDGIDLLESAEGTEESRSDDSNSEADVDSEEHLHENEDAHDEEDDHSEDTDDYSEDTDTHVDSDTHNEDTDHADHDHSEHSHGDENAHAWMNLADYQIQVQNICDGLSEADSAHAEQYAKNAQTYQGKVQELQQEAAEFASQIASQPVVIFHEAYEYIVQEYGLALAGEMNLDEERQVSAGEVADILHAIEDNHVSVVLAEALYGTDMGEMVTKQSGVKVVYLDTLTRGDYSADSYLEGMRSNIEQLKEAFQ